MGKTIHLSITSNDSTIQLNRAIDPQKMILNAYAVTMNASHTSTELHVDIPWLHSSIIYNVGSSNDGNNHLLTLPLDIEKRFTSSTTFLEVQPSNIPKAFNCKVVDNAGALVTTFDRIDLFFSLIEA